MIKHDNVEDDDEASVFVNKNVGSLIDDSIVNFDRWLDDQLGDEVKSVFLTFVYLLVQLFDKELLRKGVLVPDM